MMKCRQVTPPWILLGVSGFCLGNPVVPYNSGIDVGLKVRGDPQLPHGPPHWSAIGDSYSAGPGAGIAYMNGQYDGEDCFRTNGSYAAQLNEWDIEKLGTFQFLSCTGHTTETVNKWQIPDLNWGVVYSKMFVTLSVGGNDLGFGDYARGCLLNFWASCSDATDNANNLIDDLDGRETFQRELESTWRSLYTWEHGDRYFNGFVPHIAQTLYPTFFNEHTTGCNDGHIFFPTAPYLTQELRKKTNDLVIRANERIRKLADAFELRKGNEGYRGQLFMIDYNDLFDGHRLCEEFTGKQPGFSDPRVWFHGIGSSGWLASDGATPNQEWPGADPATCDPTSQNLGEAIPCQVALQKEQNPDADFGEIETILPAGITKLLHPKAAGFQKVSARLLSHWVSTRPHLRVLALGDSITNGFQSSDGAGYRRRFYELATTSGWHESVDMIGSQHSGDVEDADHEGHNSATIEKISSMADRSLGQRPNVVLLHAGTNDMASDASAAGAVTRLTALLDKIMTKCPDAAVMVAKIVSSSNGATQNRIDTFNSGVEAAVNSRRAAGKHVQVMHMDNLVTTRYLSDGIHPNDDGYAIMGHHWWGGVLYAYNRGWIKDPVDGDNPGGNNGNVECPSVPNWIPQGTIASGGSLGLGAVSLMECVQAVCQPKQTWPSETDCYDRCLEGVCSEDSPGKFTCLQCIDAEDKCRCQGARDVLEDVVDRPASGDCSHLNEEYNAVIFADIDGDGRDDYLHVKISGEVSMYWNTGRAPDEGPNAGKVQWVYIGVIASGGGARGEQVHFADMDGDGRADLVWVKDSGAASVWWNRGFNAGGDVKVVWHGAQSEEIATGIGDGKGVRLADMNGDGRADFLHLAENGAATLYINQGRKADGGGWGWWSWGQVAAGVGTSRDDIRLADMNGDGRADYISVDEETGGLDVWYNRGPESGNWGGVSPLVWWNPGKPIASGVSYLPNWWSSNTVTFGDLNGDGRDEYLYVGADDSSVYAFLNGC